MAFKQVTIETVEFNCHFLQTIGTPEIALEDSATYTKSYESSNPWMPMPRLIKTWL